MTRHSPLAGIGYRERYRSELLATDPVGVDLLEIVPDHFFARPRALGPLAERYALVFHDIGLSLGTAGLAEVDRAHLDRLRGLLVHAEPLVVSDHLALTRSPAGVDAGHLVPVWYTEEALSAVVERVLFYQDALRRPIALENIAAPFEIPKGDMSEGEFFTRLVERCGCSLLLDVTNLINNAQNFGFCAAERLASYPLSAVAQIHLAGSERSGEHWIDTHAAPVAARDYQLLTELSGRARPAGIVIERDERLPALSELVREAQRAALAWQEGLSAARGGGMTGEEEATPC